MRLAALRDAYVTLRLPMCVLVWLLAATVWGL